MKKIFYLITIAFSLIACNGSEIVYYNYNTNPVYKWGYIEYFGQEYIKKGISNTIVSLSLFSDSLSVDSTFTLNGTGQYLFLEDIYLGPNDVLFSTNEYTISNSKTSLTVFQGKNDTIDYGVIYPIGAFIYYYEANSSKSVRKYIKSGKMTVTLEGFFDYEIKFDLVTDDKKQLKGSFVGKLPRYDESLVVSETVGEMVKRKLRQRVY